MAESDKDPAGMVCLGVIAAARGLRGEVKIRSFTAEPSAIAAYGPLTDAERRRTLRLSIRACRGDEVIAAIDGVGNRGEAEGLRGMRLFVERSALPGTAPDEYYFADLIGLDVDVVDECGRVVTAGFGRVREVMDHGGGVLLDIVRPDGSDLLVPFSRAAVPAVDLACGRLTVADLPGLISGLISPGDDEPAAAQAERAVAMAETEARQ